MKRHRWRPKESFQKLSALEKLRGVLLFVCVALLIWSAVIYIVQWQEGNAAKQSAKNLLQASGIRPEAGDLSKEPEQAESLISLDAQYKGSDVIARLDIDQLNLSLPVLSETTDGALKISLCRYLGEGPNGGENLVITGHNYRNGALFGNLDKVKIGAQVLLTEKSGKTFVYTVYAIEHIKPDQVESLTDEEYAGNLSLLTCEKRGNGRLVVRCSPFTPDTN